MDHQLANILNEIRQIVAGRTGVWPDEHWVMGPDYWLVLRVALFKDQNGRDPTTEEQLQFRPDPDDTVLGACITIEPSYHGMPFLYSPMQQDFKEITEKMSSTYRLMCLSHDPAIALGYETGDRGSISDLQRARATDYFVGHAGCDILFGRFSGSLVEVGCPGKVTGAVGIGCKGVHNNIVWQDSDWLRLLLAASERRAGTIYAAGGSSAVQGGSAGGGGASWISYGPGAIGSGPGGQGGGAAGGGGASYSADTIPQSLLEPLMGRCWTRERLIALRYELQQGGLDG